MTRVLLFSSVLGIRPGIEDARARLEAAGHEVSVPDYLDGRMWDEYEPAMDYAWNTLGQDELRRRALAAAESEPDDVAVMGFSLGCVQAVSVALSRTVSLVVLIAGAIPPSELGASELRDTPDGPSGWRSGVPAQIHQTLGDPFRDEGWEIRMHDELAVTGSECDVFDYAGSGHLFTDASLPAEYDAAETELLWSRVIPFLA